MQLPLEAGNKFVPRPDTPFSSFPFPFPTLSLLAAVLISALQLGHTDFA